MAETFALCYAIKYIAAIALLPLHNLFVKFNTGWEILLMFRADVDTTCTE